MFRLQRDAGKADPAMVAKSEKETAELVARMHAKWAATPYLKLYQTALQRTLDDPSFADRAVEELSRPAWWDPSSWSLPSFRSLLDGSHDGLIVFGGIAVFLFFGWLLGKLGVPLKENIMSHYGSQQQPQTTHGSASWEEPYGGIAGPMVIFEGVFFGKSSQPGYEHVPFENHEGGPIFSKPENHTLVLARTRTGKGTRVIIPTLLRQVTSSCICIDPKGENAAVTARARIDPFPGKPFGHTVHIINPWGELAPHFQKLGLSFATYNPLDLLDRNDPNVVSIAQDLAAAICPRDKGVKDPFWANSSANILTAVLLWLTDQPGETKTLARMREIVTRVDFRKTYLPKMAASTAFGGSIGEFAGPFVMLADETFSSVVGTLAQFTSFLSDPQIKAATSTSTFSMSDLMRKLTTVYLVIPPYKMDVQRTWLRLLISAGMQAYKHRAGKKGIRCMFLIDEFPALGRLDEVPRDIATMAGYGVDYTLIVQGLDQLREVYGDAAATLINNCAYKWFCNVNDLHSAEYLSKSLGSQTVQTVGHSVSTGQNPGGGSSGASTTYGQTGRPLLMPDEVLNLGPDVAILLAPGSKPQYLRPIDYWELGNAFVHLRQFMPHLYWDPPMHWDENPLPH